MKFYQLVASLLAILFINTNAASQTGPAGIGNSDGTGGVPENIIWLDAQNSSSLSDTLVNDDDILTWSDVSGNGNDFIQQSTDPVPLFRNDGMDAGTFNVVSFDDMERYLFLADNADLDASLDELTIIVVYNRTSTDTSPRGILSKRNGNNDQESYYVFTHTGNDLFFEVNTATGGGNRLRSNAATQSGDNLISVIYDGNAQNIFLESDLEGNTNNSGTVDNSTSNLIMGALNNDYGTYFNGDIAEVIMYRSALNAGERLVIENYLSEKYGITISQDYFGNDTDYQASYNTDIRGIGTGNGTDLHAVSGFSDGLQIEATSGLDNTNEFVIFAHDGSVAHADNSTADISDPDITDRWQKDYYVEVSQNGVLDAASVETEFIFDFDSAGLAPIPGATTDYVLLYRSSTADDFTRVFVNSYTQNGDQLTVSVPASRLRTGYYTIGRGSQLVSRTWYVLQNGNWNDPATWTLDAGSAPIPNNPLNELPGNEDEVVIRNGKTVTIQGTNNNLNLSSITVDGTLDVTSSTGHDFSIINGQGTIRMSGDGGTSNFPDGTTTTSNGFGNPANGGLLIVEGALEFDEVEVFKDVRIQTPSATDIVSLGSDLTINGNLDVRFGTFEFGDGTSTNRTLDVLGNFSVENNGGSQDGRVTTAVATGTRHEFNLYGDFLNEGIAQFSDRTSAVFGSESNSGVVDLNLISTNRNQRIDCNGLTYFYRIEVDKQSTQFIADIQADAQGNFVLTGPANYGIGGDVLVPSDNQNAMGLITGSVSIGTNVRVRLNTTGNYSVGTNAKLIVSGGEVTKTGGAAITPYGIIEVTAGVLEVPSGSGITNRSTGQINISGGEIWTCQIRTSIQGVGAQGGFQQTGGVVNVWDYSAAESPILGQAAGTANNDYARFCLTYEGNAFSMTGGTLNVKDATNSGLIFINSDPSNINVTGGTVNVFSTVSGASEIASLAPFWDLNVINESGATNATISSETLTCGPGGADDRTITDPDLKVLNDLTIETGTTRSQSLDGRTNTYGGYLDLCPANNCINLEVGRSLIIEDSGVLDVWAWNGTDNTGSATVSFNGPENGEFYIGDITTYTNSLVQFSDPGTSGRTNTFNGRDGSMIYWELPLYNWVIDKPDATLFLSSKLPGKGHAPNNDESRFINTTNSGKNVTQYASNLIKILNSFELLDGTLNQVDPNSTVTITEDNGGNYGSVGDAVAYSIRLYGQVTNEGTCFVYEDGVTPKEGIIVLRKDAGDVTLNTVDGASFGNFRLLIEPDVVFITSDLTLGRLEVSDGIMDIGTHNLKVDVLEMRVANPVDNVAGGQRVFTENHHIRMAGNASDGGLSVKVPRSLSSIPDLDEYENLDNANLQDWNREYNQSNIIWYPIGTNASGSDRYTPAIVYLHDNGTIDGDEYITVRVVDGELQTTDLSGGDMLSHYWNVDFEGYAASEEPTVSWLFQYDDADVDAGDETNYVPGRVLDGGSYARSDEGATDAVKDGGASTIEGNLLGNDPANVIIFNGLGSSGAPDVNDDIESATPALYDDASINTQWQDAWPGTGFSLENANYTAGVAARFVGAPEVYYTRATDGTWFEWQDEEHWSITSHVGEPISDLGASNPGVPGAGDVVNIGSDYVDNLIGGSYSDTGTDGRHQLRIDASQGDTEVAQLIFDSQAGGSALVVTDMSRLRVRSGITFTTSTITGTGEMVQDVGPSAGDFGTIVADIGEFAQDPDNGWFFWLQGPNGSTTVVNDFDNYPTFRTFGGGSGKFFQFGKEIRASNMLIDNNVTFQVASDLIIDNLVLLGQNQDGIIEFIDVGSNITLECTNLQMTGADPNIITVENSGSDIHTFRVKGNITLDVNSANTFDLSSAGTNVILELGGYSGVNSVTDNAGITMNLYKIVMNKGSDVTSTFTFPNSITITDPATSGVQPIEILNGLLILNDVGADITLADASTGDFKLPNTDKSDASSGSGGLEIAQGIVRLEGDDTGIILDGLLRISGGTLDMSDDSADNGNNFIQYGASDQAAIEITDGSLLVGSQVRRPVTAEAGLLNYRQSGGIARFGLTAAPESNRGVFEVLNSGSEFTHTAGEFTIVRENGSTTVGSLIIKPDPGDVDVTGSVITIGSGNTPPNQNDIGIDATVPLNSLVITGNNNLTAKVYNSEFEAADLQIDAGGTFDANGFDLTITGEYLNDGSFINGGTDINQQTTFFPSAGSQQISGTGSTSFFNLVKDGAGTLTLLQEIDVENNLELLGGTTNTGTVAINLQGDMVHDAIHTSDPAGSGIVFAGTDGQNLDTNTSTGEFGTLTIDNSNGVEIPGDGRIFQVNDRVVLGTGVFNIGGNLLVMNQDAVFENETGGTARSDFNVNRMISVNASITDNGVRKIYNDAFTGTYLYPVGLNFYTPAEVNVTNFIGSTGNDNQITIKPIEDIAGGIPDDTDEDCIDEASGTPDDGTIDFVDIDNILQFYWLIRSANVESFDGSINLYHVDALEAVDNAQGLDLTNYAPARLLDNSSTWDKAYSADQFDEVANVSTFSLTTGDYIDFTSDDLAGTYTAGITVESNSATQLCGGAIPDQVPEYITVSGASTGDVDDLSSYATAPGGTVPTLGESPDLRVAGDFTLNLTNQFWRFRRVVIEPNATLTISGAGVNLGTVTGEGTLRLINTNALPAGDYGSFEADAGCTTGGGFELQVTTGNSVDVSLPFTNIRRLLLTEDGEKVITNSSTFNICENLEILDAGTLTMGDNVLLNIDEDIIKSSGASYNGDFNNARIVLAGSTQQQIDGDFTGTNQIKNLELNNSAGFTVLNAVNDDIEVENLILTNGRVSTDDNNSIIILNTGGVSGNFGAGTFVDGPLVRRLETSTDRNLFPVGQGSVYLPIEVSNTNGYSGTKDWTARYFDQNPTTSPRITGVTDNTDFSTYNMEVETVNSRLFREDLWEVEVASPANADVRPSWDSDSNVGADETSWQYLRVMVWNSTDLEWESYGNANLDYIGMTPSSGSVVSDTDLAFSTNFVTLATIGAPVPLPVDLVNFEGQAEKQGVRLNWSTASEIDNDYFEILRSIDGENFEVIGEVDGNGNSTELIEYEFLDRNPLGGANYYRLRQVDFDGDFEFSPVIRVEVEAGANASVTLYPNPVREEPFNILIDGYMSEGIVGVYILHGTDGRIIKQGAISSRNTELTLEGQPEGLYFLKVHIGSKYYNLRIIKR